MRLERISVDQFKIFITYDDLYERGYSKDDLWNNLQKANQLFQDMLYEASEELKIELDGKLIVKVHMLQAQGLIIVVTQNSDIHDEEYIELKVTMDESKELIFKFDDIEHVIQVAKVLKKKQRPLKVSLYHYDQYYYIDVLDNHLTDIEREDLISILSEYSSPSTMTSIVLKEYGKILLKNDAFSLLNDYF